MTTQASPARTSFATPPLFRRRASDLVLTGYTEITRLVARHKMFFGSSKSVRCGLPTIRTLPCHRFP